jgi:hypothetical protein
VALGTEQQALKEAVTKGIVTRQVEIAFLAKAQQGVQATLL